MARKRITGRPAGPALANPAVAREAPSSEPADFTRGGSMPESELVFLVEEAPEGGYVARALGASIVTEADDLPALRAQVRDAVRCHFDAATLPPMLRLHFVRDEIIAA
jgi:hypothetical protein